METMKPSFVGKLQFLPALVLFLGVLAGSTAYAQITPLGDSFTNTADPTTNYGAQTLLYVDGAEAITYIQFDLASIPTTASISQATLKLYVNSVTTPGSFNVDYVNGAWTEGKIDANNAPGLGTTIASGVAITTADKNQYILINVTSAVQAWLGGSEANNGIALVANSTFNATFDSKESTSTSHPAELDIAFAGGDGTITGVTTASGSGLTGGGTSGTLNLSLTNGCAASQVLEWNGSAWACASAGTGTITGVTAGTDLTGGGTSGNVTLNLNTTALNSAYAQLGAANTFAPQQVIKGNGGNAIIGDPGCGSGFSGIGLNSALSGCANYTMIGKSSGDVYVNSTSSGYIHFRNGNSGGNQYNDLATIDNKGNLTAAGTVVGTTSSSKAYGVTGVVTATTGTAAGVLGETSSTSGYGVYGSSANVGVYGQYSSASEVGAGLAGAGVWGDTGAPDGLFNQGGVLGTADDSFAGQFVSAGTVAPTILAFNLSTASGSTVFTALGNGGDCYIDINGNLTCSGKIGDAVKADGGAREVSLYAMQSAENWFEDAGSGQLANGSVHIALDSTFAQTVNTGVGYHVFLTPKGDCEGLYVTNETPQGFDVHEARGGHSGIAFDYRIMAKRAGYEKQRLEDVTERYQKTREQEEKRRERMAQLRAARAVSALPVPTPLTLRRLSPDKQ